MKAHHRSNHLVSVLSLCILLVCFCCSILFPPSALGDEKKELLYLSHIDDAEMLAKIKERAPNIRIVNGLSRKEALSRAAEFHGADVSFVSEKFLSKAMNLRWVQA